MIDILSSILAINSNAKATVTGENVSTIRWHDNTTPIAEADILAKQAELQADYEAKEYQRSRASEYPSIGEQLDMIYHAGQGGDAFQAAIQAVKNKYPKS
jgi:hypothetical protein